MPGGAGRSGRTKLQAITGLFKAAVAAVTRPNPDAPNPAERRRRRGSTDSGAPIMRAHLHASGPPSARGRFAVLAGIKTKAGRVAGQFARAATSSTGPDVYEDAALYMAVTLAALQQLDEEALAADFDGDCSADHTYLSLDL